MIPTTLRLWIDAVKRMEADPAAPVTGPLCDGGTLVVEDIRSEADLGIGTRIIRCTRCGHHSTSRHHFAPQAATSDIAAEQLVVRVAHNWVCFFNPHLAQLAAYPQGHPPQP